MSTTLDDAAGLTVAPPSRTGPPADLAVRPAVPAQTVPEQTAPAPLVPRARKGGRVGLSKASVIAEAARIADETGDARVPLATVADRLGVRLPSLYKHVAGVDGLRRGLARLAAEGLRSALDAVPPADGGAEPDDARRHLLAATAAAYRGWAREHPGLFTALVAAPHPQDAEHAAALAAVTNHLVAICDLYGGSGDDAVLDDVRLVRTALHGFSALETTGGLGVPEGLDRTFDRLVRLLDEGLRHRTPAEAAPAGEDDA